MATSERPLTRVLRPLGVGGLMIALLTSGCLLSKVGYANAPVLIRWSIGDYVDLDPAEREQLERVVGEVHQWHRRNELPAYAAIALEAARRIETGRIKPADLDWAESVVRERYEILTSHLGEALADLAAGIEPAQVDRMSREFIRGNRQFRAEHLGVERKARIEKRVDKALGLIEDWVGHLDGGQRRVLTARVAALPETADHRYEQRLTRQRAIRSLFESRTPRDELVGGLKVWLIGWNAGRSAEHERIHAEWYRQSRQVVLDLDGMLTRKQRARVVEKLREHAADFRAWSARKD